MQLIHLASMLLMLIFKFLLQCGCKFGINGLYGVLTDGCRMNRLVFLTVAVEFKGQGLLTIAHVFLSLFKYIEYFIHLLTIFYSSPHCQLLSFSSLCYIKMIF